ncbi:MAG: hypothetical protein AAF483_20865 [Planctomycetota bacterium]
MNISPTFKHPSISGSAQRSLALAKHICPRHLLLALVALTLCALSGCTEEQRQDLADKANATGEKIGNASKELAGNVKENVSSAAQKVTDQTSSAIEQASDAASSVLPQSGSATINLKEEVAFSGARMRFINVGTRGKVVQLRSYVHPSKESFPSFLFQSKPGSVTASSLGELTGSVVEGKLFVQTEQNGPVWSVPLRKTAQIQIESTADNGELVGKFSPGQLESSSGESQQISGTFSAFVEPAQQNASNGLNGQIESAGKVASR